MQMQWINIKGFMLTPEEAIFRILLLPVSATYTAPVESTDTPHGLLILAAVPKPFAEVAEPDPAKVDTTPAQTIHHSILDIMHM